MGYDGGDVFWFLVKVVDKIAGDTLSSVAHSYKPQIKENVGRSHFLPQDLGIAQTRSNFNQCLLFLAFSTFYLCSV